ncbi:hypothetical protein [Dictyobacter arantiisoli]|uniref:hypothetical protein n=1 Tax=Dictyobacter arantiisoli TaxID=2014874 RepID=UPI0011F04570|nr:hypothetical protein [Dictyobacter arantiisoli]
MGRKNRFHPLLLFPNLLLLSLHCLSRIVPLSPILGGDLRRAVQSISQKNDAHPSHSIHPCHEWTGLSGSFPVKVYTLARDAGILEEYIRQQLYLSQLY